MSFVEFYYGARKYRLTDVLACEFGVDAVPMPPTLAILVLRGALSGPTPILATQFRSAFSVFDGGRASAPVLQINTLADRIAILIGQNRLALFAYRTEGMIFALHSSVPPAPPPAVTADQLRTIMPGAGTQADSFVDALNAAMVKYGIDTLSRRAAFLAQIAVESGDLNDTEEKLNYSAQGLMASTWKARFPDIETAKLYVGKKEKLANFVYAGKNGNGDEASGDGWKFRGRGLMQITGRTNYRDVGYEDKPDELSTPGPASDTAGKFWTDKKLNKLAENVVKRAAFDKISKGVNGKYAAQETLDRRWKYYQRGLQALKPKFEFGGTALPE